MTMTVSAIPPKKAQQALYGQWPSPISPEQVTAGVTYFSESLSGFDGYVYWLETRPQEAGRVVLVRCQQGQKHDVTPPNYSVKTRVYEYGGGSYAIDASGIYFVNQADQNIYVQPLESQASTPKSITQQANQRYTCLQPCQYGLFAVVEEVSGEGVKHYIAHIDTASGTVNPIIEGRDFYGNLRINAAGDRLTWVCWDHPNMPWDAAELWCAKLTAATTLTDWHHVAGGSQCSVVEPRWSPWQTLVYASDHSGWWNLYQWDLQSGDTYPVYEIEADCAGPMWVQGLSHWDFTPEGFLLTYYEGGLSKLCLLQATDGNRLETYHPITDTVFKGLETAFARATGFAYLSVYQNTAVFIQQSATAPDHICRWEIGSKRVESLSFSQKLPCDPSYLSQPRTVTFTSSNDRTAYALYYPPTNPDFQDSANHKPPLLVKCHGGPTAMAQPNLDLRIQFWTSRGFAVIDVNYAGSSGFGRAYREALKGQWGVYDWQDCEYAARYAVEHGWVDPKRLVIRGSSAGGYTVLCALAFGTHFVAGASYYGVSNLEDLLKETHKFESHYLETLVGPYATAAEQYQARSPINHADKIKASVIFFQGEQDTIVPPNQAKQMAEALEKQGIATQLVLYPTEQHGFREAKTLSDALAKELAFYVEQF